MVDPRTFGERYGEAMPGMVVMVHVLCGLTAGLVHGWLTG